jgi:hypothetical protein
MFRISDPWTDPSIGSDLKRLLTMWESKCEGNEGQLASVKMRVTYKTTRYSAFPMSGPGKSVVGLGTRNRLRLKRCV